MGMFMGLIGFLGFAVSFVILIVKAITRKSKKGTGIALAACFALFILGFVIDTSGSSKRSGQATSEARAEASVDRTIPDDFSESTTEAIVEEVAEEHVTEKTTEEITTGITTEQKTEVIEVKDVVTEELAVVDTKEITEESTIEDITEVTTESTTEVTTEEITTEEETTESVKEYDYVLNTNTGKFHNPSCNSVNQMKEKNKQEFHGTRDEVIDMGYVPCKNCNP